MRRKPRDTRRDSDAILPFSPLVASFNDEQIENYSVALIGWADAF